MFHGRLSLSTAFVSLFVACACSSEDSRDPEAPLPSPPAACETRGELVLSGGSLNSWPSAPCHAPVENECGIQAKDGTLYYCTLFAICARDASGVTRVLETSTDTSFATPYRMWLHEDGMLVVSFAGVYEVSLTGEGPRRRWAHQDEPGLESAYEYDGKAVYWAVNWGSHRAIRSTIRRLDLETGELSALATIDEVLDELGNVERSAFIDAIRVAGDRVDFTVWAARDGVPLWRLSLNSREPELLGTYRFGKLLTADAEASYALANPKPGRADQWVERELGFYRLDEVGRLSAVWSDSQGHLVPAVAAREGEDVYVAGRALYAGEQRQLVVGRAKADGGGAEVLGCAGPADASTEIAALTLDADWIYVLIDPQDRRFSADVRRFRR